jgi:hypothetical protein
MIVQLLRYCKLNYLFYSAFYNNFVIYDITIFSKIGGCC